MADHSLDISVGADTSKARNELELLNAQMRKTQKEIKATSDVAVKTGDPKAVANVKALTTAMDGMTRKASVLKKEVNEANKHLNSLHEGGHAHKFYLVEQSLQSLNGALMAIGHNVGGAKAAIAGFAIGIGFTKLNEMLNEFSKNLGELRATAGDIGIKPIQLQGAQRVVQAIGDDADVATKALQGMNAQFEELRKNPPGPGSPGAGGAFGVSVGRGGQPGATDFSKPLQMLGIESQVAALSQSRTPDAPIRAMRLELQALVRQARNFDPTALNIISKTLFAGVPANSMLEAAPALLRQWEAEIKKLETSSAGATAKSLQEDKELIASKNAVANAYSEAAGTVATTIRGLQIGFNQVLATGLPRAAGQFQKDFGPGGTIAKAWERDVAQFKKDMADLGKVLAGPSSAFESFRSPGERLLSYFKGLTSNIGTIWQGLWKGLVDTAKKVPLGLPDVKVPGLPQVFRGGQAGTGSLYNPEGEDVGRGRRLLYGGHGPYGREVQSDTPGVSDYQAPPRGQIVYPSAQAEQKAAADVSQAGKSAASASENAAEASKAAAEASKAAAEASNTAVQAWVQKSSPLGFAEGGMIRGPGSGTSDSIMARLSNGEFVMSAAAVSHWGPGLMSALNGLHSPGFSGGGMPRFAEGGMVAAGAAGGTPVHLHLDGQQYAMSAESGVAQALVVASRRYQMRSAGIKPSWYGGRAGG